MVWFDPVNWTTDKTYSLAGIDTLYNHFPATSNAAQFDHMKVLKEWCGLED